MPTGRHVPLAGVARLDVDHGVEEVRLAVLAAEVLREGMIVKTRRSWEDASVDRRKGEGWTYATDDIVMVGQVRLARLAAIYLGARKVGVVLQAHRGR